MTTLNRMTLAVAIVICGLSSCTPLTQRQDASTSHKGKYYIHTVSRPGENLIRIATWYTGSGKNYLQIEKANPAIDSKKMHLGDVVFIPEELLITRQPMPVENQAPTVRLEQIASPAAAPPSKAVETELFGPIDSTVYPESGEKEETLPPLETIE